MRAFAAPLAAVVALTGTGCGPLASRSLPIGVDSAAVTGVWVHDDDDTSTGASLTFRDDGTLTYDGVPAEIVDPEPWPEGLGCNATIAESSDLRTGEGTWELRDSKILVDFPGVFTWAYPTGFLSFDGVEFICDIDHASSYVFTRDE